MVEANAPPPQLSSPQAQLTVEEAGLEEIDEEVDIGSTTPLINDE